MSIIICEKCDKMIDTDFDAEHEDECCATCGGTGMVEDGIMDDMIEVECQDCKEY